MTGEPLHPVGPELGRKNKRILAERTGWPAGALDECERLDAEFPDWSASWAHGDGLTWRETGYYAQPSRWPGAGPSPFLYGATAGELRAVLEFAPATERGPAEFHPIVLTGKD